MAPMQRLRHCQLNKKRNLRDDFLGRSDAPLGLGNTPALGSQHIGSETISVANEIDNFGRTKRNRQAIFFFGRPNEFASINPLRRVACVSLRASSRWSTNENESQFIPFNVTWFPFLILCATSANFFLTEILFVYIFTQWKHRCFLAHFSSRCYVHPWVPFRFIF